MEEPTQLTIEVALEQVQNEIDQTKAQLDTIADYDGKSYTVKADVDADQSEVDALVSDLQQLEAEQHEIQIYAGIDDDEAMNGLEELEAFTINDKRFSVFANTTAAMRAISSVVSALSSIKDKTVTVTTIKKEVTQSGGGSSGAYGNAHAYGTAHERGVWGTKTAEKDALVGELGEEIIVFPDSGVWQTVGENGAVMMDLPKGAIIFNHRQTEELLKNRRINSRGQAYAWGNAHAFNFSNKDYTFGTLSSGRTTSSSIVSVRSGGSASSSTSSNSDSEIPWEDELKYYQHLRAMELITDQEYYNKLDELMSRYYSVRESYIDDYRSLMEDAYDLARELADDWFNDKEHELFGMEKNGVSADKQIMVYREMQKEAHRLAEEARAYGLEENSDYIQQLQKQWWDYEDSIRELRIAEYESLIAQHENAIELMEHPLNDAINNHKYTDITSYTDDIIKHYKKMQDTLHDEAEYYRSLGYSETSEEITELRLKWWEYYDAIAEASANAWQQIVDNANDAVDEIQGLYDTLKDAAQQYAESGFITVDTLQEICSWGVQYLAYLRDEDGQLVINEESIQRVIAARTEQMAVETALSYVQQIRSAAERGEINELAQLTLATENLAEGTWDLVYAQLKWLNVAGDIDDSMYAGALQNINNLRALSDIAINSIGKVEGAIKEQADYLDKLLKYVEDMIKQETKNQIEALNDQIDAMKNIVDLQKKELDLARQKDKYTKTVAEKTKELAKISQQIAALELDDSKNAQAKKAELLEKLAELQEDLADEQADHAYDVVSDSLDDMFDAYKAEKEDEIKLLEKSISSEEKLYQLAIERINNHWDTLYEDLINWNYEYGTVTNDEITAAWNAASQAVLQYGSYLEAVLQTQQQLAAASSSLGSGIDSSSSTPSTVGKTGDYDTSGASIDEEVHNIIRQMYANSQAWNSASDSERKSLDAENLRLGEKLSKYIPVYRSNGTWYTSDGSLLYQKYKKYTYHSGGIVGDDPTLKQDEVFAKLKKGEAVFTEEQQKPLYQALDFADTMIAKYGQLFNSAFDSDLMASKMQDQIKSDSQQTKNMIDNSNNPIHIEVNAPIQTVQKLDEREIRRMSEDISKYTISQINESFVRRGKRGFRP